MKTEPTTVAKPAGGRPAVALDATHHEKIVATNEALVISAVRLHELVDASDRLNAQLREEIARRTKIQEALSEKVRLLDLSTDAILVLDAEHRIRYWNRGAEGLYGWTAEEALGQVSYTLLQTSFEKPFELITEVLDRTGRWTGVLTHTRRGGERVSVLARKVLDRDGQGKPVAIMEYMTDITERTKAEEVLREAQALLADRARHLEQRVAARTGELTAMNQQLEAFVYSIAHDLRAPLRSMEGFSVLLAEEAGTALNEKGRDYVQRINKSARFMDALLRDLLAFSRVSQQRVELVSVSLHAVVESVLSRLQKDIRENRARVKSSGPWPAVLAHESTLAQVVFNLTSNALKFVVPGVPPQVRLWAEEKSEFIRVWVEDDGPGIAADHQAQIFGLFTRLDGEKYPGTGIGLAIVQKGIERMGGRAGVESAPGHGSRFWFELRKA